MIFALLLERMRLTTFVLFPWSTTDCLKGDGKVCLFAGLKLGPCVSRVCHPLRDARNILLLFQLKCSVESRSSKETVVDDAVVATNCFFTFFLFHFVSNCYVVMNHPDQPAVAGPPFCLCSGKHLCHFCCVGDTHAHSVVHCGSGADGFGPCF